MPTAQTIITQALVDMGVYSPGELLAASDLSNGLNKLNQMLDNWSGARDLVYEIASASYALTPSQSFAIGPSAAAPFNVPRPIKIENAAILIVLTSGHTVRFPLDLISQKDWDEIYARDAMSTVPQKLYYDPQVPNAVIYLYPTPIAGDTTNLELNTWAVVNQFSTLATNANLPPAYLRAITLGLEMELIPTYGMIVNPGTVQIRQTQFQEALAVVKSLNSIVQMEELTPTMPAKAGGNQMQQLAAMLAQRGGGQ